MTIQSNSVAGETLRKRYENELVVDVICSVHPGRDGRRVQKKIIYRANADCGRSKLRGPEDPRGGRVICPATRSLKSSPGTNLAAGGPARRFGKLRCGVAAGEV